MATLNFKGKTAVWNYHLSVPFHTLEKNKKASVSGESDDENLVIEGDNLLALKALLPKYQGKIKCIYIDPPYNTGHEGWKYSDNVNSPLIKTWFNQTVGKQGEDLTRHDKWLCMITPRLKLLRELLADDGAIFISIDDNEQHHLRSLMDEIFGEDNLIANFSWRRKKEISNDAKGVAPKVEYVIAYSRSKETIINRLSLSDEYVASSYSNPNKDPRGDWRPVSIKVSVGHQGGGYSYKIKAPSGKVHTADWTMPESTFKRLLDDGRIYFGKGGDALPQRIIFLAESRGQVQSNLLLEQGTNKDGKNELIELFGEDVFETPKPVSLIRYLLSLVCDESSIVLDSFAGSGTTGEAVMDLNKDGGKRRFILVEMEGYAKSLTAERVRKAIQKQYKDESFSFCTLGPAVDGRNLIEGKKLPSWENLAKYVHYLATGKPLDEVKVPDDSWEIIAGRKTGVFLMYENNLEKLKNLAVTREWLEKVKKREGRKIVYAPACFLDKEVLDENDISFVQLPFNLFKRAA